MGCGSSVQPRSAGQIRNGAEPQNNDVPLVSLNAWYDFLYPTYRRALLSERLEQANFLMSGNTPFSCTPSGQPVAATR